MFVLDNTDNKDKDVILDYFEKIFEENFEETLFKNKAIMKALHYLSEKFQIFYSWTYFTTGHGKGVDRIGGEEKSKVCQSFKQSLKCNCSKSL